MLRDIMTVVKTNFCQTNLNFKGIKIKSIYLIRTSVVELNFSQKCLDFNHFLRFVVLLEQQ